MNNIASSSLLPPNASKLERDIEQVITSSLDLPLSIADLWDPFRCPLSLLPWLAWAYSVDQWEDSWPVSVKRQVVNDAFEIHRYKGTPYAVQQALNSLGIKTNIIEWWEPNGSNVRGTMKVNALVKDKGIDLSDLIQITNAITSAKRGVIHAVIRTVFQSSAEINHAATTLSAQITEISYYTLSELNSEGMFSVMAGSFSALTVTVEAISI
ncbi:phage tail protein I [Shewanella frigidimarina]|uniref:phage tail protein I n=1 Tax=Shewanella frigidimarina TaxID=56812 RepID=UPI003D7A8DC0